MSFEGFVVSWNTGLNKSNDSDLEGAIRYWCNELQLDESSKLSVMANTDTWIQHPSIVKLAMSGAQKFGFILSRRNLWGKPEHHHLGELSPNEFKHYIGEKRKVMETQNNVDVVLLAAFVLVGVGFLISHLNKNPLQQEHINSSSSASSTQNYTLVLVTNAGRKDLLESLDERRRVTENNWEDLYNATRFLWIGTTLTFSNSNISKCFSEECTEKNSERSEYDVRFIRIDLSEWDAGFSCNAPQIDRRDAFERLTQIPNHKLMISCRQSSEAYANKEFYNR